MGEDVEDGVAVECNSICARDWVCRGEGGEWRMPRPFEGGVGRLGVGFYVEFCI